MQCFSYYFKPLDRGFVNEAIISMLARSYRVDQDERRVLESPQYEMDYIYFTMEGGFALHSQQAKIDKVINDTNPFLVMRRHSVFGDYQLMFDLSARFEFRAFIPNKMTPLYTLYKLKETALEPRRMNSIQKSHPELNVKEIFQ